MNIAKLTVCLAVAAVSLAAHAQGALYKVIGADGRITYTDRAPMPGDGRAVAVDKETGAPVAPVLPLALRNVVARFPVMLYTMVNCGDPCDLGRALLVKRGVPFQERRADTDDERLAWKDLVGGIEAPTLTVGGQSLRGYVPVAWDETLDTAGYPRQSLLPANYQPPAAMPLVERRPAPRAAPPTPRLPAPEPTPGGIRF